MLTFGEINQQKNAWFRLRKQALLKRCG